MFLTRKPEEIDMDEDRVKELHTQLVEFQRDQDAHLLEFPTTLSGRDRFLVHEVKLILHIFQVFKISSTYLTLKI